MRFELNHYEHRRVKERWWCLVQTTEKCYMACYEGKRTLCLNVLLTCKLPRCGNGGGGGDRHYKYEQVSDGNACTGAHESVERE